MNQISNPNEKKDEKLEFLKREEIRTMQKDIARLREIEAQKERERIAALKIEEKTKKEKEIVPEAAKKEIRKGELETLIPKLPPKPSSFQKILVRVVVAMVLFLIIGFFYWFFEVRPNEVPPQITPSDEETPTTTPSGEETPTTTTTPAIPEITIPTITDRILSWGYYIPIATRTIDTIIILSATSPDEDPYSIEGVIRESQKYRVSPHYLISREGIIYRLVPDEYVAYHAGSGQMPDGSRKNIINNFSIGIELIYMQTESPNDAQYESLAELIAYLKQRYNIPSANILGHNEISPSRKTDPWNFDWEKIKLNE